MRVNAGADLTHMKVVTKPVEHLLTCLGGETLALKRNADYPGQIGPARLHSSLNIAND